MRVSLRTAVGANDRDAGTEVLDEVPSGPSDCEEVHVVADIAEDLERCVMLEEKIHLDTQPSNVLEHVGELHVFRIRPKAIESVSC